MQETVHPLKAYRKRTKTSLQALGGMIGRSKATLSRIERGKQPITEELLKPLSDATGIPAADLRPDLAKLLGPAE